MVIVGGLLVYDWTRTCTLVGCTDGPNYVIPDEAYAAWGAQPDKPVSVETCIDDVCVTEGFTVEGDGEIRPVEPAYFASGLFTTGRTYTVTLKVMDPSGMVRYARTDSGVTLTEVYPNGRDCPPACKAWVLALEPEDLGL